MTGNLALITPGRIGRNWGTVRVAGGHRGSEEGRCPPCVRVFDAWAARQADEQVAQPSWGTRLPRQRLPLSEHHAGVPRMDVLHAWGELVWRFWMMSITDGERELAMTQGSQVLLERLTAAGADWCHRQRLPVPERAYREFPPLMNLAVPYLRAPSHACGATTGHPIGLHPNGLARLEHALNHRKSGLGRVIRGESRRDRWPGARLDSRTHLVIDLDC